MYRVLETQDFYPLSLLFQASGLEVKPSRETPPGTLAMWRCEEVGTGRLLAAVTLQTRAGHFVLAQLAVAEDRRGQGLGEMLLALAEDQAARRGADRLWLVGKVPKFYEKYRWVEVDRQQAPAISRCLTCDQFQVDCFPSIMKKDLGKG